MCSKIFDHGLNHGLLFSLFNCVLGEIPILLDISVLLDVQTNLPENSPNGFGEHLFFKCLHIVLGMYNFAQPISIMKMAMPKRTYNPITAMGFSAMFIYQLDILKGKYCRHHINVMGLLLPLIRFSGTQTLCTRQAMDDCQTVIFYSI